jgi:hypothetical protein
MVGKLITLPLRVWLRSACLLTRAATGTARRAVALAQQPDANDGHPRAGNGYTDERREAPARPAPARSRPTSPVGAIAPARPPRPEPPAPVTPTAHEEPVHVSAEPELVCESAEPGAEEGAGAGVTVLEPWNGYAHMNAREVIARANQAGSAELAAVRLYESRHRRRQTVLAAVDRQLKLGAAGRT